MMGQIQTAKEGRRDLKIHITKEANPKVRDVFILNIINSSNEYYVKEHQCHWW